MTTALSFVGEIVETLRRAGLDLWLFGGWAEELRGMRAAAPHADIDLLLRAESFAELEAVLAVSPRVAEIREKRFSHKRAFVWDDVRVEFFLARPGAPATTSVFDDRVVVRWPTDTFTQAPIAGFQVASAAALLLFRRDHRRIVAAYAAFRLDHDHTG